MGAIQAFFAAISAAITVLTTKAYQCTASVTGTYTATITLETDGTISVSKSGGGNNVVNASSGPTNWYTPTTGGIGSTWYARLTTVVTYGSGFTGTLSTSWQSLASAKTLIASAAPETLTGGSCSIELSTSASGPATVILPVTLEQQGYSAP